MPSYTICFLSCDSSMGQRHEQNYQKLNVLYLTVISLPWDQVSSSSVIATNLHYGQFLLLQSYQRSSLSAEPFFLLLDFVVLEKDSMNRVRFLLSMRSMFLRYSFEPRPNSRALATSGSVMAIGLSINGCSHSKKPVLQERAKLTSPEV